MVIGDSATNFLNLHRCHDLSLSGSNLQLPRYWPISRSHRSTSLRDGVIPTLWKTAHVIPLPKKQPPRSIEKDIRPISLTPIVLKIFESIVMKWVDHNFGRQN